MATEQELADLFGELVEARYRVRRDLERRMAVAVPPKRAEPCPACGKEHDGRCWESIG